MVKNLIKYIGNTERFAEQSTGVLVAVESKVVKTLKPEMSKYLGSDIIPRGTCIICIYQGDKGIPFADVRPYGSTALLRLKKAIGQTFVIDTPLAVQQLLEV